MLFVSFIRFRGSLIVDLTFTTCFSFFLNDSTGRETYMNKPFQMW